MKHLEYFDTNLLVHTHIEKAAGTTLIKGFAQIFGKDRLYDNRLIKQDFNDLPMAEKQKYYMFSDHTHITRPVEVQRKASYDSDNLISKLASVVGAAPARRGLLKSNRYVCVARDPLSRLQSYVFYATANLTGKKEHPLYYDLEDLSLNEATEWLIGEDHPITKNHQCAMVAGDFSATFEDARRSLEENYVLIAPYKKVNKLLTTISTAFDARKLPETYKRNTNPKRKKRDETEKISGETRKIIESRVSDDQKLYEYIEENHQSYSDRFIQNVLQY